ncbi:hypothetical protein T492DRAFT_1090785 [Pavlovales sp. CCMP2436]|nr:hypothetical protein T492DRAFT_1090785 [Pavlovales sp. CCMP2436]
MSTPMPTNPARASKPAPVPRSAVGLAMSASAALPLMGAVTVSTGGVDARRQAIARYYGLGDKKPTTIAASVRPSRTAAGSRPGVGGAARVGLPPMPFTPAPGVVAQDRPAVSVTPVPSFLMR